MKTPSTFPAQLKLPIWGGVGIVVDPDECEVDLVEPHLRGAWRALILRVEGVIEERDLAHPYGRRRPGGRRGSGPRRGPRGRLLSPGRRRWRRRELAETHQHFEQVCRGL